MQIPCPHCHTLNRVADERLDARPVCGRCKQSLLPDEPIILRDDNFGTFTARCDLPVLVDFWAAWCGPCQMMAPQFTSTAERLAGKIVCAKLDTEANPATAQRFAVRSIPTLVLTKHGVELARLGGSRPAAEIVQWVHSVLAHG